MSKKSSKASAEKSSGSQRVSNLIEIIRGLRLVPNDTSLIAILPYGDRKERQSVDSSKFREYILAEYHSLYEECPSDREIANAITIVKVEWEKMPKLPMTYRVNYIDNAIYYDLFDNNLSYVEITDAGWEVRKNGTDYFISGSAAKKQATPAPCANGIDLLDTYLNLSDDATFFFKICAICCFHPEIIVPILYFQGEKGTGKSAMLQILGELVDPSLIQKSNLDSLSERDMGLSLSKSFLTSFDNVSRISRSQSDLLCQAVTGGMSPYRKLYTNDEIITYDLQCRVGISAIHDCIRADDLEQRIVKFHAKPINERKRMDEVNFWKSFAKDKPFILGDIFELLSIALKIYPLIRKKLKRRHRLASFTEFGYAVASAMQPDGGGERFMSLLDDNADIEQVLSEQDKLFVQAIEGVMSLDEATHYENDAKALYDTVDMYVSEYDAEAFDGFVLGDYLAFIKKLRRLRPALERKLLVVAFSRTKDNTSYVTIEKVA